MIENMHAFCPIRDNTLLKNLHFYRQIFPTGNFKTVSKFEKLTMWQKAMDFRLRTFLINFEPYKHDRKRQIIRTFIFRINLYVAKGRNA